MAEILKVKSINLTRINIRKSLVVDVKSEIFAKGNNTKSLI